MIRILPRPIAFAALLACATPGAAFAQQASQPGGSTAASQAPRGTGGGTRESAAQPVRPCSAVTVDPPTTLTLGKSRVISLPFPVARVIVGGGSSGRDAAPAPQPAPAGLPGARPPGGGARGSDGVADSEVTLLGPTELFFLPRRPGSMNVVLQGNDGRCLVKDMVVTMDPDALQSKLAELLPDEPGVRVRGADHGLVLTGSVNDVVKLEQVLSLARIYGGGQVVNMLRVNAPQQVMLEVTIAEVSKTILDRFGIDFTRLVSNAAGTRSAIISGLLGAQPGVVGRFGPNTAGGVVNGLGIGAVGSEIAVGQAAIATNSRGATLLGLDMQNRDGIFRVLAEPNIMAITGQAASFLSGGKIFIPVARNRDEGGTTVTLEEKEFGVGLRFTPTVLDGRINLKVVSEVSELSQSGTPFTTVGGLTAILPSMTTRKVDTTVQLADGQSFMVAGLIKNNFTESLNKFPGLGDTPVVGALFRSTEFQNDQTELMFVVTPRLVKPIVGPLAVPTDNLTIPSRAGVMLQGAGEGPPPPPRAPASPTSPAPAAAPATVPPPPPAAPARPVSMLQLGGHPRVLP